ncbi:MAG: DNA polymerase III subunit delta' [Candidatus Buchananbacteria bacterium]
MSQLKINQKTNAKFPWGIIGHHNLVNFLQSSICQNKYSQAYLFVGPAGSGKQAIAEKFLNSLYCFDQNPQAEKIPCGVCQHCQQLAKGLHPDVFWLRREINEKTGKLSQDTKISQIRELQEKLNLHPFLNSFKFAVIEEAETLNEEAYNALLKTLEEPFPKSIIILLAKTTIGLPATILSRCQTFHLFSVSQLAIVQGLETQGINPDLAAKLAKLAIGRPGQALNFLDPEKLTEHLALLERFLNLKEQTLNERFKEIKNLLKQFKDSGQTVDELTKILNSWQLITRDLIIQKAGAEDLVFHQDLKANLAKLAATAQLTDLLNFFNQINLAKLYLKRNLGPQLVLENLLINY